MTELEKEIELIGRYNKMIAKNRISGKDTHLLEKDRDEATERVKDLTKYYE